jgi:hypothetical protein
MIEIKSRGEGKAELIRNKRRGLRLKVCFNFSFRNGRSYCERCYFIKRCDIFDELCLSLCHDFERVAGTRKFWFERDED